MGAFEIMYRPAALGTKHLSMRVTFQQRTVFTALSLIQADSARLLENTHETCAPSARAYVMEASFALIEGDADNRSCASLLRPP
jgi:hypothetical protein